MSRAIEAVKKWLELETVGAFEVMNMYGVTPSEFWEAYRGLK